MYLEVFLELSCGHVAKFPLLMADRNVCMMGIPAILYMNLVSFSVLDLGTMELRLCLVGVWKYHSLLVYFMSPVCTIFPLCSHLLFLDQRWLCINCRSIVLSTSMILRTTLATLLLFLTLLVIDGVLVAL